MFTHLLLSCLLLSITSSADCGKIEDQDKRSFHDLSPVVVDADGDGQPDSIAPRTYIVKANHKLQETHWIAFDLKTSKGRTLSSFFKYQYGTSRADYWVYALVPCDINQDGKIDLIFYSGDDTSDETIVLLNSRGRFIVHSRKLRGQDI
jgi:hypothetical protein